ncbi:Tetratricopeptide repeat protein [Flavimaricola marinus]|uniref:Tetratricopeptide repeat protein n=2 Tax=Flavimaricola marinus TaxID=1819565 RepID=A0A238LF22_9RHOB|nr:Tetratricopeptide repeat protein [Flavimaricola marinus]
MPKPETPSPQTLEALREQTMTLHKAGKIAEARPLYARYLEQAPDDALMWSNLGALLRSSGQHELARVAQRRAYALEPDRISIANNLANILADLGECEEALELRREVLKTRPDDPMLKAMIGKVLRSLGRTDDAVSFLEAARDAHPDEPEIAIQLAMSQLAGADYVEGFRNFDARWRTNELTPRQITKPKWDGAPLNGKRILVLPEQGFGDGIAFARFLPMLQAFEPAEVIMQTERPVARLYEGLEGVDRLVVGPPPEDAFDVWTNLMDLPPLHFEQIDTPPAPTGLHIPQDSRDRARALVAPNADRFKVGVVWSGSLTYRANAFRSFSHTEFHRLLDIPEVQMFSLYKGPKLDAFRADGSNMLIIDAGSRDRDFADCAALMEEMDLIITSDTATAHLAGSLGCPVWTLLHWDAFWLWRHEGPHTPWYPSMRLFRQTTPRDWSGVFTRVRTRLFAEVDKWKEARA